MNKKPLMPLQATAGFGHSEPHTRLARSIARLHGIETHGLQVGLVPDGNVCVRGPGAVAVYPAEGWLSRFTRHLIQGHFRARAPARLH